MNADQSKGGRPMNTATAGLKHVLLTDKIIGVFYAVYNEMGYGFLESVYVGSMEIALRQAGLRVERNVQIPVWFRGYQVGTFFADLVVESVVILELKSARAIDPSFEAQLLNYLRATTIEVGLLLNFGQSPKSNDLCSTTKGRRDSESQFILQMG
jgi:GxxExxY protein